RCKQVAGFFAEKGDGPAGVHGAAQNGTGGSVDAAWQVHGDYRKTRPIDRRDGGQRLAGDRAVKSGAKQRIDDDVSAGEIRDPSFQRPVPLLRRSSGISLNGFRMPDEVHGNLVASALQLARSNEAVAAIVAGSGHNSDPAARGMLRRHRARYG